ncbi:MAG: hypothetical protein HY204_04615 [Nitrospirae bacterium]|nr:hypothetical protein [Nitrospirota bacterium]
MRMDLTTECNYRRVFFAFVLILALLSPFGQVYGSTLCPDPAWVPRPPQPGDTVAVVGVATASTLEEGQKKALLNAAGQVLEYLGITLREEGKKIRSEVETRLLEEMTFFSDRAFLQGGLLQKWCFRSGPKGYEVFVLVHYPLAMVEEAKDRMDAQKRAGAAQFGMEMREGDRSISDGKFVDAMRHYANAYRSAGELSGLYLEKEVMDRMTSLLDNLRVIRLSGDEASTEGDSPVDFFVQVMEAVEGEGIPMEGVPVRFYREGQPEPVLAEIDTDFSGKARLDLGHFKKSLPAGVHHILAELNVEKMAAYFPEINMLDRNGRNSLRAVFSIKKPPSFTHSPLLILVEESLLGKASEESIVGQTLSEKLMGLGFRVISEHEIGRNAVERLRVALQKENLWPVRPELRHGTRLVVTGTASGRKSGNNLGMVLSSQVDVYIRVVDLETGEVVAQKNSVALAGFGGSYEQAAIQGLKDAARQVSDAIGEQLLLWEEGRNHEPE